MVSNPFSELVLEKYLDWQRKENARKTVAEFADYVGLGQKTMSHALNGSRPPSMNTVDRLANFFDDPRFYEAARKPSPLAKFIVQALPNTPKEIQRRIAEELSPYTTDPIPNGETGQSNKP